MKYPRLVRNAKTPCHIKVESEEIGRYGACETLVDGDFSCNYQSNAYTKITAEKQIITLSGKVLIDGDIAPELPEITGGECTVLGVTRKIYRGTKARNPDGTVNYTMLELI